MNTARRSFGHATKVHTYRTYATKTSSDPAIDYSKYVLRTRNTCWLEA